MPAHRVAWVVWRGPIPDGLWVLHTCDNPPCCNPAHLFLGTRADNIADMVAKGRADRTKKHKGEQCHQARLTADDVRCIRASRESNIVLSRRYGVSPSNISMVRLRRTWAHVL